MHPQKKNDRSLQGQIHKPVQTEKDREKEKGCKGNDVYITKENENEASSYDRKKKRRNSPWFTYVTCNVKRVLNRCPL
jgi:hypothetical protein